jgi:hypothetical protein
LFVDLCSGCSGCPGGAERDIAIKDWFAFVATGSGLSVMNVAVAENPFRAGFLNLTGEPVRVEVSATHAFVACGSGGLVVVDITNPESMFVVGNYGTEVKSVCLSHLSRAWRYSTCAADGSPIWAKSSARPDPTP